MLPFRCVTQNSNECFDILYINFSRSIHHYIIISITLCLHKCMHSLARDAHVIKHNMVIRQLTLLQTLTILHCARFTFFIQCFSKYPQISSFVGPKISCNLKTLQWIGYLEEMINSENASLEAPENTKSNWKLDQIEIE